MQNEVGAAAGTNPQIHDDQSVYYDAASNKGVTPNQTGSKSQVITHLS